MEKRGVCDGEGEEPVAGSITKLAAKEAVKPASGCCGGRPSCGSDTFSKAAEEAAKPTTTPNK